MHKSDTKHPNEGVQNQNRTIAKSPGTNRGVSQLPDVPATAPSQSWIRAYGVRSTRLIAALGLLAIAYIHVEQYYVADYRFISAIGTLFLLNSIAATILGLYFLTPTQRDVGGVRWLFDTLAALAGWGLAATSLVALEISEHTPLFGFMEHGYRSAIVFASIAEGVVVVALGILLAVSYRLRSGRADPIPAAPLTVARTPAAES